MKITVYISSNHLLQLVVLITLETTIDVLSLSALPSPSAKEVHHLITEMIFTSLSLEKLTTCWLDFNSDQHDANSYYRSTVANSSLAPTAQFDQSYPEILKSSLCLCFIRDLQLCLATRLKLQLVETAAVIDSVVRASEQRCARLMTIVKPMYKICELLPPTVPVTPGLEVYPMEPLAHKERLHETSVETSSLLLFRASRTIAAQSLERHSEIVLKLIESIIIQLSDRYLDEGIKRINRKLSWAKDRITGIENYRKLLVKALHHRQITSRDDKAAMKVYKVSDMHLFVFISLFEFPCFYSLYIVFYSFFHFSSSPRLLCLLLLILLLVYV